MPSGWEGDVRARVFPMATLIWFYVLTASRRQSGVLEVTSASYRLALSGEESET